MPDQPLVSIIIPTYNRAHLISETLDSIVAQTYTNWECIVVDDGSIDGTSDLMEEYGNNDLRFQYHHRPKERLKGANACRNYGFEKSEGEFVMFLDSDDLLSSNCLKSRVKIMIDSKSLDFAVFTTQRFMDTMGDGYGMANTDPDLHTQTAYLNAFLGYEFPWTITSAIWDRKILERHSFNERLQRLQDLDFHIRVLFDASIVFKRIDVIDNYYRFSKFKKQEDKSFRIKVVDSFMEILETNKSKIIKNHEHKTSFKKFCMMMSRAYLYEDCVTNKSAIFRFEQIIREAQLLTFNENLLFYFQKRIMKLGLHKKSGIGMYQLMKYFSEKL